MQRPVYWKTESQVHVQHWWRAIGEKGLLSGPGGNRQSRSLLVATHTYSYSKFVKLYKSFVRPILEFANAVWTPILQRNILLLEFVQQRAIRVPFGRTRPQYFERLSLMNLTSLTQRRLRGDFIVTFQAFANQLYPIRHLFTLNTDQRTRGHRFKLLREVFRTTIRQFFITNRVFHHWNSLRDETVSNPSVISFKIRYDTLDVAST
ncbi:hypothetical protein Zmor_021761 [Zophobas morio]|uniref:Uncharacterized protein n=1 Tax=Zophobas morio TaxID=2755281 RepID=A0AA38I8R3_9CUCU|nr:hypothetical protein Zmor_021761 [Zophobas morio]